MFRLVRLKACTPYELDGKVYDSLCIGRSQQNQLSTTDRLISSRHVRFVVRNASLQVVDLDSRNGTEVNGARLVAFEPCALKGGDVVDVAGRLSFRVEVDEGADYPVIVMVEPKTGAEEPAGQGVVRVLALPEGLTPVLDASRLLTLHKQVQKLIDPTRQADGGRWLETLVTGAARVVRAADVQLLRVRGSFRDVIYPRQPAEEARGEALSECLRRKQTISVEVSGFDELDDGMDVSSTVDGERIGRLVVPTLCGLITAPDGPWGILYTAESGRGSRRSFSDQDVWLMQAYCQAVSSLLPQVSVAQIVAQYGGRYRALVNHAEALGLVGRSAALAIALETIANVASGQRAVALQASSGAQAWRWGALIHQLSARGGTAYVRVEGDDLARLGRPAGVEQLLAAADGGTLFVGELEALGTSAQRLLFEATAGAWGRRVRLVASSALPPEQLVSMLGFHEGLARRLAANVVRIPTLRERPQDMGLLAVRLAAEHDPEALQHFDEGAIEVLGTRAIGGDVDALQRMVVSLLERAGGFPLGREQVLAMLSGAAEIPEQPASREALVGFHPLAGEPAAVPLLGLPGALTEAGVMEQD